MYKHGALSPASKCEYVIDRYERLGVRMMLIVDDHDGYLWMRNLSFRTLISTETRWQGSAPNDNGTNLVHL